MSLRKKATQNSLNLFMDLKCHQWTISTKKLHFALGPLKYTANIYSQTTASLQSNGCISDWITAIDSAQWLAVIQYSQFTVLILSLTVIMNFFTYMGNSQTFGCNLAVQSKS